MRRLASPALMLSSLLWMAACGRGDLSTSINEMNEGVRLYEQGQHKQAADKFQSATKYSADNHQAWYMLGQTLERAKDSKAAADAYTNAVKIEPDDAMYHYRLGKVQLDNKNLSEAQSHLETAIKKNNRLYKAHFFLGEVYEQQGKPKEAATEYSASAELGPYFGKAFYSLGRLYTRWDKFAEAIAVMEEGQKNVKDAEEASNILHGLGMAYLRSGDMSKAIEAFGRALDRRKDNIEARYQRGVAYAEKFFKEKNPGDKENGIADLDAFAKSGGRGNALAVQNANQLMARLRAAQ